MAKLTKEQRREIRRQIASLKGKLRQTDYIACKIAEGEATKAEYSDVIAQRREWRTQINELEERRNGN